MEFQTNKGSLCANGEEFRTYGQKVYVHPYICCIDCTQRWFKLSSNWSLEWEKANDKTFKGIWLNLLCSYRAEKRASSMQKLKEESSLPMIHIPKAIEFSIVILRRSSPVKMWSLLKMQVGIGKKRRLKRRTYIVHVSVPGGNVHDEATDVCHKNSR